MFLVVKEILRSIRSNIVSFMSILIVCGLGCGFLSGFLFSSNELEYSANKYFNDQNLYDVALYSPFGLSSEDIQSLSEVDDCLDYMSGYTVDSLADVGASRMSVRVNSMDFNEMQKEDNSVLNKPVLADGRWPTKPNEIVLCEELRKNHPFSIGDKFSIFLDSTGASGDSFEVVEFDIVGSVHSPQCLYKWQNEPCNIGNGVIEQFAFCFNEAFSSNLSFNRFYCRSIEARNYSFNSEEFKNSLEKLQSNLNLTLQDIKNSQKEKIIAGLINDYNYVEFFSESFMGPSNLDSLMSKIDNEELFVYTILSNKGVLSLQDDIDSVSRLSKMFPMFFYIVAAVACLSYVNRRIEDEKHYIGTLKALGFNNIRIAIKYYIFFSIPCFIGSIVGILFLYNYLPRFVVNSINNFAFVPYVKAPVDFNSIVFTVLTMHALVYVIVFVILFRTLKNDTVTLLKSETIKSGYSTIFRKIPIVWKRLSFNWRLCFSNILFYKKYAIMTAVGITACVALVFCSVSLYFSASLIVPYQYGPIVKYDTTVRTTNHNLSSGEHNQLFKFLGDKQYFDSYTYSYQRNCFLNKDNDKNYIATILCPRDYSDFSEYYSLHNGLTKETYCLDDYSVIINEKLATLLNIKEGDSFDIYLEGALGNKSKEYVTLSCGGICEFYVQNYIFIGYKALQKAYEKYPDLQINYDVALCKKNPNISNDGLTQISSNIRAIDAISFVDSQIDYLNEVLDMSKSIIYLFFVFSFLMCIVILYCVTNISVIERIREIATMKSLGFFNRDIQVNLLKEIIVITTIGVLAGIILGILVSYLIMPSLSGVYTMYVKDLSPFSFIISILSTYLLVFLFMLCVRPSINRIDMTKQLKKFE
ncbi:MAG: FtsX-like permease family protein [Enterococcus sp.]|nr:FtsX-like permease family protein [Enterococcus sp.]